MRYQQGVLGGQQAEQGVLGGQQAQLPRLPAGRLSQAGDSRNGQVGLTRESGWQCSAEKQGHYG
jgi:hypothetical protein